jgi:hypothetical protein
MPPREGNLPPWTVDLFYFAYTNSTIVAGRLHFKYLTHENSVELYLYFVEVPFNHIYLLSHHFSHYSGQELICVGDARRAHIVVSYVIYQTE